MAKLTQREANRLAFEYAATTVGGDDLEQVFGEDLAGDAWNDSALADTLTQAQQHAAQQIRRRLLREENI